MIEFTVPSRVIFGEGTINRVGELVKGFGERVFLVSDAQAMHEAGYLAKVKKLLEDECYGVILYNRIYSHSRQDSNSDIVNRGANQAKQAQCNVVVGLGGKTTLNIAKAIAFLISNGGKLEDYFLGRSGGKKKVKYIEIPAGYGFMPGLTNSFYVLDRIEPFKKGVEASNNYADLLLMDPKLTTTIPGKSSAHMGIELLALAIESLVYKKATAISESFAVRAIELLATNLTKSIQDPENIIFKTHVCMAGVLTSLAIGNSSPGVGYALSMGLKSAYGLYQGVSSSILLPHIMEFNLTSCANKYVQIAKAFGENVFDITIVEAAIKAIEEVRKIIVDLRVPTKLSEMNIEKDNLMQVAKSARNYEFMHYIPRPVSKEDLHNILNAAF